MNGISMHNYIVDTRIINYKQDTISNELSIKDKSDRL